MPTASSITLPCNRKHGAEIMYLQYFKDLDREQVMIVAGVTAFVLFLGWLWISWYNK
jgi:hypothetical protein